MGPYQTLGPLPDAETVFVAEQAGPVPDDDRSLSLVATESLSEVTQQSRGHDQQRGAEPSRQRVVFDGKYVTAAGVSAGIDRGLTLAGRIAGDEHTQAVQLMIEYDPQPPYDAGSPVKAPAAPVELISGAPAPGR